MTTTFNLDTAAAEIKATVQAPAGTPTDGLLSKTAVREKLLYSLQPAITEMDQLRAGKGGRRALDINLDMFVKEKFGYSSVEAFYAAIDLKPTLQSIDDLMNVTGDVNSNFRWLLPEIIREAVRLGLRRGPIYPNILAAEEAVNQKRVTMPWIEPSASTPKRLNEAETIPMGTVAFNEKYVDLVKMGTGIRVTDEVQKYVSLSLITLYLQDMGVRLGQGLDTMAINTLINGEGANYSAATVGVTTANTWTYKDLLRVWLRMSRLGKLPSAMIMNEGPALDILMLPEFFALAGVATKATLAIKTPIPSTQDVYVHGSMPSTNRIMLVDKTSALVKLNAQALMVESERIASRQLEGTYATLVTGFVTMFRDARIIIDVSQTIGAAPFPSWMDVGAAENVVL